MRTLAELLHPITPEQFRADYDDRKPLHIPAAPGTVKQDLLRWDGFNTLLDQASIWTPQSLKLVFNGDPIPATQYCAEVKTPAGPALRPSPSRIQPLLAKGASLIADGVEALTPEIATLSTALSSHFAGLVGANIYCSFGGVQAFNTHFDLHHVFAVQVEGEKTWRLYQNRADQPIDFPTDGPDARQWFARTRGPLMQEVLMRPGDVLYLPRGWYHDALTPSGSSLHVTFSVTPLYGRIMFGLLEAAALQDPAFRTWLRPATEDGGRPLKAQLRDLGRRLAALAETDTFLDEIAMTQERLSPRPARYSLPDRPPLVMLHPTGRPAPAWSGPVAIAMDWIMTQPGVPLETVVAQFDFIPEADLRAALAEAERLGVLRRS